MANLSKGCVVPDCAPFVANQADQGRILTEENGPIGDCCTTCSFRQAVIT